MPGFDGTGPAAGGPMTGWGRGYCNSAASYGLERSLPRRGVGLSYGRGRGYRHIYRETGLPRRRVGGQTDRDLIASLTIHRKTKSKCSKRKPKH